MNSDVSQCTKVVGAGKHEEYVTCTEEKTHWCLNWNLS